MALGELEAAALQEGTTVPDGLQERIQAALAAKSVIDVNSAPDAGKTPAGMRRWIPLTAVAAAAAIAAIVVMPRIGTPALEDTYTDPALAYAQVEATFKHISDKMAIGMDKASEAVANAEKPMDIISKINEK